MVMDIALASLGRRQSTGSNRLAKRFANQSSLTLAISLIRGPVKVEWSLHPVIIVCEGLNVLIN